MHRDAEPVFAHLAFHLACCRVCSLTALRRPCSGYEEPDVGEDPEDVRSLRPLTPGDPSRARRRTSPLASQQCAHLPAAASLRAHCTRVVFSPRLLRAPQLEEEPEEQDGDVAAGIEIMTEEAPPGAADLSKPRMTTPYMTKYERARVLGTRALQISMNAPVMVDLVDGETDPLQIASKELREKRVPFTIRRYLPDGTYEDWGIHELIVEDPDKRRVG